MIEGYHFGVSDKRVCHFHDFHAPFMSIENRCAVKCLRKS